MTFDDCNITEWAEFIKKLEDTELKDCKFTFYINTNCLDNNMDNINSSGPIEITMNMDEIIEHWSNQINEI